MSSTIVVTKMGGNLKNAPGVVSTNGADVVLLFDARPQNQVAIAHGNKILISLDVFSIHVATMFVRRRRGPKKTLKLAF